MTASMVIRWDPPLLVSAPEPAQKHIETCMIRNQQLLRKSRQDCRLLSLEAPLLPQRHPPNSVKQPDQGAMFAGMSYSTSATHDTALTTDRDLSIITGSLH